MNIVHLSTGFGIKYASSSNKGDGFQANANLSLPVSVFSLGLSTIYRSRNYSTLYESLQIDNIEDPLDDNLLLIIRQKHQAHYL